MWSTYAYHKLSTSAKVRAFDSERMGPQTFRNEDALSRRRFK